MINKVIFFLLITLSFHSVHALDLSREDKAFQNEYQMLYESFSTSFDNKIDDQTTYVHVIESVNNNELTLTDGMKFSMTWWYQGSGKNWKKGDHVYITFDFSYKQCKIDHVVLKETIWTDFIAFPKSIPIIKSMPNGQNDPNAYSKITLSNGHSFKGEDKIFGRNGWNVKDEVIVFANPSGQYQVWNLNIKQIITCKYAGSINGKPVKPSNIDGILGLEERLNQKVLQQPLATKTVAGSMLIYSAGLKEKNRPVGVFLFLGPTGVGKTELAKALNIEIYKDPSCLLRFDMSHFVEPHSVARLIGSPPGYVNHEEGGQLTEPLLENSQRIVLLDEIEKAHPQVHKLFLPVFDEGFCLDSKNNKIDCSNTIFIMTSNLCGQEIAQLFQQGYSSEEILEIIEPKLMKALSPELYNRVEPVLFRPLEKETMGALVDLFIKQLTSRIWEEKQIKIIIDSSLRNFLMENGYHPLLGARPLRSLIERRVVATIAYSIIKDNIENDSEITIMYDQESDSVFVVKS